MNEYTPIQAKKMSHKNSSIIGHQSTPITSIKSANIKVNKMSLGLTKTQVRYRNKRNELRSSNVSDHPNLYDYKKPSQGSILCASTVRDQQLSMTNKPHNNQIRDSGAYTHSNVSTRNSYQNAPPNNKPSINQNLIDYNKSHTIQKVDKNEIQKSAENESSGSKFSKTENASESYASNIFDKLFNWYKKDLTKFE